jgi:hypothetical protein
LGGPLACGGFWGLDLLPKEAKSIMKVITLKKAILLTIAVVGMGLAPTADAAHATEFLDPLHMEITTRLENLPDETEPAVRRALQKANAALNRNTRTLSADLGALSQAGNALASALADDGTLNGLQNDALNAYSSEAQSQLNDLLALIGTSEAPRSLSNQLNQIQAALDRGNDGANSTAVRAKAISFALNKIRVGTILATRTFKAPVSLTDKVVTLTSRQSGAIVLDANGTYTIGDPTAPDETGTWTYDRLTSNAAVVTLSGGHTLNLKFAKPTNGTYSEETEGGTIRGKFIVEDVVVEEL